MFLKGQTDVAKCISARFVVLILIVVKNRHQDKSYQEKERKETGLRVRLQYQLYDDNKKEEES